MPPEDKEKLNRLERLKAKLFSKSYDTKIEYRDSLPEHHVKGVHESWEEPKQENEPGKLEKFFAKSSVFKKFFIFSLCFFGFAVLYVGYMFLFGGNTVSNDNIDIFIFGNTFASGGEDLPLQIEIVNRNASPLELVDLVVEYPRGSEGDLAQDTERLRASLGSIPAGGVITEGVNVILFGREGSVRPVRVAVEYRVEGSNSIFVKEKFYQVSINAAPIDLAVNAPAGVSPGQDITLNVRAVLNADRAVDNLLLRLDYPVGFEFTLAEPTPSLGDNVWDLKSMRPGEERTIMILGRMVDVFDGEQKTFHVSTGLQARADKSLIDVVYNSLAHTVDIERPFIGMNLVVNNQSAREYAVSARSPVLGQIVWSNNLDVPLSDLSIRARFYGNALDRRSLRSQSGFYSSAEDVIVWDRNSSENFARVEPGRGGTVSFSFTPNSLVGPSGELLFEPTVRVEVSVTGKQLLEGNIVRELHNSETKTIKVSSEVGLTTRLLHSTGPFTNAGSLPPKVEEETFYTVVWNITNTANNISGAEITSSLPPWVRFVGEVFPANEDLRYNSATREIVWRAGNIPRGAGILGPSKEVAFQIAFLPSLSQRDTTPVLIQGASLSARDAFTNVGVAISRSQMTTAQIGDPGFQQNIQSRVAE